jgi:hypothetical protein
MEDNDSDDRAGFFASRAKLVLLGFLAIAGYFLVTEHWAHIIPFLPWRNCHIERFYCPLLTSEVKPDSIISTG